MANVGDKKIVNYEYRQKECEICGEPAMHRMSFLLEDGRRNPASSAYRHDDCSYCSDEEAYCCDEHKEEIRRNPPYGMTWCSDFYVSKNEDGTFKNLDSVCGWVKTDEKIIS